MHNMKCTHVFSVYSLPGIGHTGEVPYGKDFYGKTNCVTDTYNDNSLREIARLTGGSFHYLRSQSDIPAITESILRKINK